MSNVAENERRLFYVGITRARKGVLIGTSEIPSRFVAEIKFRETEEVIEAMLLLANGERGAEQDLLAALQNGGGQPGILQNLANGYLPDLGQKLLAEQIQRTWALPSQAQEVKQVI